MKSDLISQLGYPRHHHDGTLVLELVVEMKAKRRQKSGPKVMILFYIMEISNRQENTSINAQENESSYSDIFGLILVALFQKRPKAAFSKIITHQVALFLPTFSRLAAAGSLKKLASIKASVSFPDFPREEHLAKKGSDVRQSGTFYEGKA